MKITFMGAGSTVFARNVIGDCMCSEVLRDSTFARWCKIKGKPDHFGSDERDNGRLWKD